MENWKIIGPLKNYQEGHKWIVEIETKPIALFKYENNYFALKNGCMHQGFPLAEGNLNKYMVECPLHGWVYDIRNGKCLSLENKFTISYQVRIKDENIEVNLN